MEVFHAIYAKQMKILLFSLLLLSFFIRYILLGPFLTTLPQMKHKLSTKPIMQNTSEPAVNPSMALTVYFPFFMRGGGGGALISSFRGKR